MYGDDTLERILGHARDTGTREETVPLRAGGTNYTVQQPARRRDPRRCAAPACLA